jgi:hypothetical protein
MYKMLELYGQSKGLVTDNLGKDTMTFCWGFNGSEIKGYTYRGECDWIQFGSPNLPFDDRVSLPIERLTKTDLVAIANFCDVEKGFRSSWPKIGKTDQEGGS